MSGARLYFRYAKINLLSFLQYRGWIFGMILTFFFTSTDPLEALLMLDRFGAIGDWTASRILLVYGMAVACFGLSELFARGFDFFPAIVRSGQFDRLKVRPRSLFLQVLGERFHLHRLSRVVGGGIIVGVCLAAQGAPMTPSNIAMLACALLGGMLVYVGVFMLTSAPAFWTMEPMDWVNAFTNGSYQAAKVPYPYLPDWLRTLFLYIVPMFVFCYFPVSAICGWGEPAALGWLALPVGAAFCGLGLAVWGYCSRYYRSAGS